MSIANLGEEKSKRRHPSNHRKNVQFQDELNLGITATRVGLTRRQKTAVISLHFTHQLPDHFKLRHGGCIGGDEDIHKIFRETSSVYVIVYPQNALSDSVSTFCVNDADEIRESLPPLVRNRLLVDESSLLIACPKGGEYMRSGTWATIRYARKVHKEIWIVWPDGTLEVENGH